MQTKASHPTIGRTASKSLTHSLSSHPSHSLSPRIINPHIVLPPRAHPHQTSQKQPPLHQALLHDSDGAQQDLHVFERVGRLWAESDDPNDTGAVGGEVERGSTSQDGGMLDSRVVEDDVEEMVAVLDIEGEEGLVGGSGLWGSELVLRVLKGYDEP